MEFDKSKVYTAVNAEELPIGSKCIFANTMLTLINRVKGDKTTGLGILSRVLNNSVRDRFETDQSTAFSLAYLIEPPKEPQYKPFSNIENLKKAVEKHSRLIATKQSIKKATIIGISFDERIIISTPSWGITYSTFEQLFESYIFDDGTPCGELMEE